MKHLQSLLDNEKILRIQHQEECGSLKMRLDEEKAKLERNKSLLTMSGTEGSQKVDNTKTEVNPAAVVEAEHQNGNPPCIFELRGVCDRKDRCKFRHNLSPSLLADAAAVSKILLETSVSIGKCAFEMTERGSCPGKPTCNVPHENPESRRRICFRELVKEGSCPWGKTKCRFSHQISKEEREDQGFIGLKRQEKDEKASKCINEFRQKGSCRGKGDCPFSHNITDHDRMDNSIQKRMEEKHTAIKNRITKKVDGAVPPKGPGLSVINQVDVQKEMMTLKEELQSMKEMIKAFVRP